MPATPTDTFNGIPCLRFRTASDAVAAEGALREQSQSYQTKITKTRKRGLEYVVLLFG